MGDTTSTILAAVFEFGFPLVLIFLAVKIKSKRHLLVPTIGAVTPFSLFMLIGLIDYYFLAQSEESMYLAGFIMGLFLYILSAFFGFLAGLFTPKKVNSIWRYFIGLLVGPGISYILVALI